MFNAPFSPSFRHANLLSNSTFAYRWQVFRLASLEKQLRLPIYHARALGTEASQRTEVPFRKQFKDEAKHRRATKRLGASILKSEHILGSEEGRKSRAPGSENWKLTVGLEVHAQLNTERKLFSDARASDSDTPNSNVSVFDLACPGSQPQFQKATLLPALRAAVGLSCKIHRKSKFDRKHYYYQDQPAGYQITQYYEPFATNGQITVYSHDGIALEDDRSVKISIKQIQMEQDTAKSILQPPATALLDFNRVGHPLIEIITQPEIHHPQTAAACVRKIQAILQSVNAVTTGMEMGGLRVDVNVSVSPRDSESLGQRTEIKNLSSFKAIEDAIIAERDRQIAVLESGGTVEGETRGWTLGSTETKKLRGKEGEVDYRYMPDPDIPPLIISKNIIDHISESLPTLPEDLVADLVNESGLTVKDAKTLITLDNGERLDYFDAILSNWQSIDLLVAAPTDSDDMNCAKIKRKSSSNFEPGLPLDKIASNWVLHELGGLLSAADIPFSPNLVPPKSMASILSQLHQGGITGTTAKQLVAMVFDGEKRSIDTLIMEESLGLQRLSREDYLAMAQTFLDENEEKVRQIQEKGKLGKLKWFVGQMMRQGQGNVEAARAQAVLEELLQIPTTPVR